MCSFLTASDLPVDLRAVGELLDPAGLGVDAHPRHVAVQGQMRPARQHRRRPGRHRHVGRRSLDRLLPKDRQAETEMIININKKIHVDQLML